MVEISVNISNSIYQNRARGKVQGNLFLLNYVHWKETAIILLYGCLTLTEEGLRECTKKNGRKTCQFKIQWMDK